MRDHWIKFFAKPLVSPLTSYALVLKSKLIEGKTILVTQFD